MRPAKREVVLLVSLAHVCLQSVVGQGTVLEPTQFLHSSNTEFNISVKNGGGAAKGLLIEGGYSGGDARLLEINSWDGLRTFFSVTDDYVGVGTNEPGAPFTVVRPGYSPVPYYGGLTFINQSSNPEGVVLQPALELRNGGGNGFGLVSQAANNYFSGRIGIGTLAPREVLDFGGRAKNIRFDYSHFGETGSAAGTVLGNNFRASTNTNDRLEISSSESDAAHAIYMRYSTGWHFVSLPQGHGQPVGSLVEVGASSKVHITTAGNLGVGINNPSHKLEVNGTIRAKEIIVETANFPDYVFRDGYPLRSLAEVEAHISERGHLPGVPSGEEVAAAGLSLGEGQRLLLEKIEELTLYAIEQNRRTAALQAQSEAEIGKLRAELLALKQQLESAR